MQIDDVYNRVKDDLRKTRNGFYSITQFNQDAYRAVLDAFSKYWEGYSATQTLHDALSVFKATPLSFTPTTSQGGIVALPADYAHLLSASIFLFDNERGKISKSITLVNEDERDARLQGQVRRVSIFKPIAVEGNNQMQIYPALPLLGEINYLRLPKKPVYNYAQSGRAITYNPTGSQDIEFRDIYMPEIINRIVDYAQRYMDEQKTAA